MCLSFLFRVVYMRPAPPRVTRKVRRGDTELQVYLIAQRMTVEEVRLGWNPTPRTAN